MKKFLSTVVVVVVLVVAGAVSTGGRASAQVPDIVPNPPPPPAEVQPVVNVVSPVWFHACMAPSTAQGLVIVAGSLAGVGLPVPLATVMNPLFDVLLFDLTCAFFSPKIVPPTCGVDDVVFGTVGVSAVNTPLPASIIATEVLAIERALNHYGAPVGSQVSDQVWLQLGCDDS
jgi:hypothetical protein